jgi:seryl-tRNA synthetase
MIMKNLLIKLLRSTKWLLEPLKKQVEALNACCDEISKQRAATASDIQTTLKKLQEALNKRETALIKELDQKSQSKLKSLSDKRDEIETTLAQLHRSLRPGNEEDVKMMMMAGTANQVKALTTPFQPTNMEFTPVNMVDGFQNYGEIKESNLPKFEVDIKNIAMVGEKCTVILNFSG